MMNRKLRRQLAELERRLEETEDCCARASHALFGGPEVVDALRRFARYVTNEGNYTHGRAAPQPGLMARVQRLEGE